MGYNVFTSHGPDLYGTEPASFYLMNGFLNFNFIFLFALVVLPVQTLARHVLNSEAGGHGGPGIFLPDSLSQAPLYLWLLVFWTRPHKEERFLFPIYPLICLAGAMVIDSFQKLFYYLFVKVKSRHFLAHTRWLGLLAVGLSAIFSLSRMAALYQGYHGVTDTWMAVNQLSDTTSGQTTVCVGKEWYRFTSSFFLPTPNFRIAFLKSEFTGQLPEYYPTPTKPGQLSTQVSSAHFNDLNKEEPSRYIKDPGMCDYIVDLEDGVVSDRQPCYASHPNWTVRAQFEFLDAPSSNPLLRAFYVPWASTKYCRYNRYLLLGKSETSGQV